MALGDQHCEGLKRDESGVNYDQVLAGKQSLTLLELLFRQRLCSAKNPTFQRSSWRALPLLSCCFTYRKLPATLDPSDVALGISIVMLHSVANHTASFDWSGSRELTPESRLW